MSSIDLDKKLDLLRPSSDEAPLPDALEKLLAEDGPKPVRALYPPFLRLLAPLLVALVASLTFLLRKEMRPDAAWLIGLTSLARIGFGCFFMWLALRSGVPGREPSRRMLLVALAVGAVVALVTALLGDHYGALRQMDDHGPKCSVALFGASLLPLAAIYWMLIRSAVFQPLLSGALGGLSVAMVADAFLSVTCPISGVMHTLVYHTGGTVAFALLSGAVAYALRRLLFRRTQG